MRGYGRGSGWWTWAAVLVAAVAALAVGACGGEGAMEPLSLITPVLAPQAGSQGTATADVCQAEPNSLDLVTRRATFGDSVDAIAAGWDCDEPIRFFLISEEQSDIPLGHLFNEDLAPLGQVEAAGGSVSIRFLLQSTYKTEQGHELAVARGDELFLVALQRTATGSRAQSTGPLTVE
jgi:hypothetical protein